MIRSLWTIKFDPDGSPITLATEGTQRLNEAPPMNLRQEVETIPLIEDSADHAPRDRREGLPWTLEVMEDHATLTAAEAHRETRLAAIAAVLLTPKPLEVVSTAVSVSRRMADAVIEECEIRLVTPGSPRTLARYVIHGKPFAAYTP